MGSRPRKRNGAIWIATLNGLFGSMAAFGTDQELMQRLPQIEMADANPGQSPKYRIADQRKLRS